MKNLFLTKTRWLVTIILLTTLGSGNVWGEEWTWTASSASQLGSNKSNSVTLNGKLWTTERSSGTNQSGLQSGCIQLGAKGSPQTIVLRSSAFSGTITSVAIECSSYSANHSVSISVGENPYLSSTATAKWTTIGKQTGTGTSSGEIEIAFTKNSSAGALYIKSITVVTAPAAAYTVSFNTGVGNPSVASRTEASGGTGITLPSTSDLTPSCSGDGWTLYGWATSAYGSSSTTTAPTTTLAGLAGDTYYPSSNETLYAVYRKADGASESTSTTYTINGNWTTDNGNWTKVAGNDLNGALSSGKYGLNSGSSSATSPVSYSEISAIQFTGTKSSSGAGSVEFLYGSGSSWTSLGSKNISNTLTWSVDPTVSGDLKIVFTRTKGNIYIASIKVTYTNASYVYWSNPNCCTPLGSINGSI